VIHAIRVELVRVSATAQELGKAPLGAGAQGLQTMRDVGLTVNKRTGRTFMEGPYEVLDPANPESPLHFYTRRKNGSAELCKRLRRSR